jgi:folylpolyglutamate synthase/dihydropteroate synthase
VADALDFALRASDDHASVIITGSLFVAAEAEAAWAARTGASMPEIDYE